MSRSQELLPKPRTVRIQMRGGRTIVLHAVLQPLDRGVDRAAAAGLSGHHLPEEGRELRAVFEDRDLGETGPQPGGSSG
jgi:hypothetical protein